MFVPFAKVQHFFVKANGFGEKSCIPFIIEIIVSLIICPYKTSEL